MGSFWLSGQTGLGKSTLINTIFASHLIDSKGRREADEPVRQTTEIQTVSHGAVFSLLLFNAVTSMRRHSHVCLDAVITENGVRLRLNIVDTPGYGDQVNNENWFVAYFCF
jgi:septin family protein